MHLTSLSTFNIATLRKYVKFLNSRSDLLVTLHGKDGYMTSNV
jgi:hypothetical protein